MVPDQIVIKALEVLSSHETHFMNALKKGPTPGGAAGGSKGKGGMVGEGKAAYGNGTNGVPGAVPGAAQASSSGHRPQSVAHVTG